MPSNNHIAVKHVGNDTELSFRLHNLNSDNSSQRHQENSLGVFPSDLRQKMLPGGLIQFVDPAATNAQRFYRFGQPVP
jgi:hypothetical protein